MTSLGGGTPVHYLADEPNGWQPDLEDIRAKVTPRTKAIVVINPNNPTGAVYSREVLEGIAEIARENSLLVLSDEIYDRILFDDAQHIPMASVAPDLLCLTFNGLSKTYRVAGYRSGWLVITGPEGPRGGLPRGHHAARLHAAVPERPGAARRAGGAVGRAVDRRAHRARPGGSTSSGMPRGRASRRSPASRASSRRARSTPSRGSTPTCTRSATTRSSSTTSSSPSTCCSCRAPGFNWPTPDHVRIVTLPEARVLSEAIERLGNFLASYKQ